MNLILRPLDNVADPVWSVIICVILAVVLALGYVIYILREAFEELADGCYETTKSEKLLQF
jgi:hypothetical protein